MVVFTHVEVHVGRFIEVGLRADRFVEVGYERAGS